MSGIELESPRAPGVPELIAALDERDLPFVRVAPDAFDHPSPKVEMDDEAAAGEIGSRSSLGARSGMGEEIRLRAPGPLVFYVNVGGSPGGTVTLVSDGRVMRTLEHIARGTTEVFEVECERDGYYRLEVRDRDGKMLALTNPIYVKVGARR